MDPTEAFTRALLAPEPAADLEEDLYGWLVGAWDTEIHDFDDPDGPPRVSRGEWIFARTLEGRSIHDLFIVPSRRARAAGDWGEANVRYGVTHRQPIPGTRKWTIDYFGPARGVRSHLVAERQGDEIMQVGVDEEGRPLRWVFYDMAPDRFLWRAERQVDGAWRLLSRFHVSRRADG